jgi:hypothetical protein
MNVEAIVNRYAAHLAKPYAAVYVCGGCGRSLWFNGQMPARLRHCGPASVFLNWGRRNDQPLLCWLEIGGVVDLTGECVTTDVRLP